MDRRMFIAGAAAGIAVALDTPAQQPSLPLIGFLGSASPAQWSPFVAAFRKGLNEAGYVEGTSVIIEFRWAEGSYDRLAALADELVQRRVSVIVATGGTLSGLAAKKATPSIPIVFTTGADPVALGLVTSLARPEGNVTGVSFFTSELLLSKRLQLLHELVPTGAVLALFANPTGPNVEASVAEAQQQATSLGHRLVVMKTTTETEIDEAFATFPHIRPAAFVIAADPVLNARREQFVALAARYSVLAVYEGRESVEIGGLMSYGPSLFEAYRQVGIYAGRILKGARPAELPVLRATKFELVINMRTAKAQGVSIPRSLLLRADDVIH